MTANQIAYQSMQEQRRANLAKERENHRSNVAKETETNRSNLANEYETRRSNLADEELTRFDLETKKRESTSRTVRNWIDTGINEPLKVGFQGASSIGSLLGNIL